MRPLRPLRSDLPAMKVRALPEHLRSLLAAAAAGLAGGLLFSASTFDWHAPGLDNLMTFGVSLVIATRVSVAAAVILGWPVYLLLTRLYGACRWWWPILAGSATGVILAALLSQFLSKAPVFVSIGAAAGLAFWLTLKAIEGDHGSAG